MKIIEDNIGNYIRTCENTPGDFAFLKESLSDWPSKHFTDEELLEKVEHASTMNPLEVFTEIVPAFTNAIFIYCNQFDEPMVFLEGSFYYDEGFCMDLTITAAHPNHRGAGKFSDFIGMMTWVTNKLLKVEYARGEIVNDNPATLVTNSRLNGAATNVRTSKKQVGVKLQQVNYSLHETLPHIENIARGKTFTSYIPEISVEDRQKVTKKRYQKAYEFGWSVNITEPKITRKPYVNRR